MQDRESRDVYILTVVATNYLTPDNLRSGTATVTINVGDVNDEAPRFLQPLYTIGLEERTPVNTFVLQVNAQDDDLAGVSYYTHTYTLMHVLHTHIHTRACVINTHVYVYVHILITS